MQTGPSHSPEQARYAAILHWSTLAGFVALIVTFLAYVSGWLPPFVPLERLPRLWNLSAAEYLKATGAPTGWSWLGRMGQGDFASLIGIAILSGCSIVCIAAIAPIYAGAKNRIYAALCLLEIAVLLFAASGILDAH